MSQTYLVRLRPQEPYFFGGEYTFGKDDARKEGSRYSASSTLFPQQSALLGMLRKTLLIQNGNMTMHKKGEWVDSKGAKAGNDENYIDAVSLVGKSSFSYEHSTKSGIIEKLSPLFVTQEDDAYLIDAKDSDYTPRLLDSTMLIKDDPQHTFIFKGYSPKEYRPDRLISSSGKTKALYEVFQEVKSVGIKKSYDGQSEEDAFFQKNSYALRDGASFAFYATFSKELSWSRAYVALGADRSSFMLDLSPVSDEESFDVRFHDVFDPKPISRAILTSETLLRKETYDSCLFVLGRRSSFRQLRDSKGGKSKRYYLLERGTVLYSDDLTTLRASLSQPHLQDVGINHFIAIQGA